MKTQIPENLKADLPPTPWGKILGMTPIVLTVVSTLLAGLTSSEMTHAEYDRSLAAQLQSKAGDQWSYYQARRLRGVTQQNTLELLQATVAVPALPAAVLAAVNDPKATAIPETSAALLQAQLPPLPPAAAIKPPVQAALDALGANKTDAEVAQLLGPVTDADLAEAMAIAKGQTMNFDAAIKPVNANLDRVEKTLSQPGADRAAVQSFMAARLRFGIVRYDLDARLNQVVGYLYELQVRKATASAERHEKRSKHFFYGMLAGQMGVIIATFALAARQKNLLWSLATAAGLGAVTFSAYVFLRF